MQINSGCWLLSVCDELFTTKPVYQNVQMLEIAGILQKSVQCMR